MGETSGSSARAAHHILTGVKYVGVGEEKGFLRGRKRRRRRRRIEFREMKPIHIQGCGEEEKQGGKGEGLGGKGGGAWLEVGGVW